MSLKISQNEDFLLNLAEFLKLVFHNKNTIYPTT